MLETLNTQTEAEKKAEIQNKFWRDQETRAEIKGEMLTLKECHERATAEAREIFQGTHELMEAEIPAGKYILYINSTISGVLSRPEIKYIDQDRLEKVREMDTGEKLPTEEFQADNIRYCLGINKGDPRFKFLNAFQDDLPEDLSDCAGIVFSGSEANLKDETIPAHLAMIKKVEDLVRRSTTLPVPIPKLGICFGAQLLAHEEGATIDWVKKNNEKEEIVGIREMKITEEGRQSPILEGLAGTLPVAERHQQEISRQELPGDVNVLAESEDGAVEIIYFPQSDSLGTQGHIEVGPGRMAIISSDPLTVFKTDIFEGRKRLFRAFLKNIGTYLQK